MCFISRYGTIPPFMDHRLLNCSTLTNNGWRSFSGAAWCSVSTEHDVQQWTKCHSVNEVISFYFAHTWLFSLVISCLIPVKFLASSNHELCWSFCSSAQVSWWQKHIVIVIKLCRTRKWSVLIELSFRAPPDRLNIIKVLDDFAFCKCFSLGYK